MERIVAARGAGYRHRCAISGCAPAFARRRSSGSPRPMPSARWASTAAQALWAVRALDAADAAERLPLFDRPEIGRCAHNEPETQLPTMPLGEQVIHDYRSLSLSLKAHPVSFLRADL